MSFRRDERIGEMRGKGSISANDVTKLRRGIFSKGYVTAEEADVLFAMHDACPVQDPAWSAFLIEAITDHIINRADPRGYVTVDNAGWLIARISQNRIVETNTELELLIRVIEAARWSPPSLSQFAIEQVKHAVETNSGPIRSGRTIAPGVVTETDTQLIRRLLCAFGSDANFAIMRAEIAALCAINEASMTEINHPSWADLFVKALANVLMFASGCSAPPRSEVLGGAVEPSAAAGLKAIWPLYKQTDAETRALARLERQRLEIVTREVIETDDIDWLLAHLERAGLTPAERLLLEFLKGEGAGLHPKLRPLVDQLAPAA